MGKLAVILFSDNVVKTWHLRLC